MEKVMKKETTASIWAHVAIIAISIAVGVAFCSFFEFSWKNFFLGFGAVAGLALIVFLIFAVPLEREWLTQKSFLWKLLVWHKTTEYPIKTTINICELPGVIMISISWGLVFFAYNLVCFGLGNIIMPVLFGQYVNIKKDEVDEIPVFPKIYIGGSEGVRFRPWMIFAVIAGIWVIIAGGKWLYAFILSVSPNLVVIAYIGVAVLIIGVIWLMIRFKIFKSIWNLILSVEQKFCIVRQIPEE